MHINHLFILLVFILNISFGSVPECSSIDLDFCEYDFCGDDVYLKKMTTHDHQSQKCESIVCCRQVPLLISTIVTYPSPEQKSLKLSFIQPVETFPILYFDVIKPPIV